MKAPKKGVSAVAYGAIQDGLQQVWIVEAVSGARVRSIHSQHPIGQCYVNGDVCVIIYAEKSYGVSGESHDCKSGAYL
ncbi:MAG: hypothetical protein WCP53_12940, partial [Verrucomicrobiota bacterium]